LMPAAFRTLVHVRVFAVQERMRLVDMCP